MTQDKIDFPVLLTDVIGMISCLYYCWPIGIIAIALLFLTGPKKLDYTQKSQIFIRIIAEIFFAILVIKVFWHYGHYADGTKIIVIIIWSMLNWWQAVWGFLLFIWELFKLIIR
jgi:hypothetical protein